MTFYFQSLFRLFVVGSSKGVGFIVIKPTGRQGPCILHRFSHSSTLTLSCSTWRCTQSGLSSVYGLWNWVGAWPLALPLNQHNNTFTEFWLQISLLSQKFLLEFFSLYLNTKTASMISSKKLIRMERKWQKVAALGRKRISLQRIKSSVDAESCNRSTMADNGHFVVYRTFWDSLHLNAERNLNLGYLVLKFMMILVWVFFFF